MQSRIAGVMICLVLLMNACATFKKPSTINEAPIHERALTKEIGGIRVSAAVVGDQEARQIFGIDLERKKIQAVWLEVENNSERPILLLPTAIDPEYFAPLEIAYAYHKYFAADANAALDAHLLTLNFPVRSLIEPKSRAAGYILTNASEGLKVIDVDLVGDGFSLNFTFFAFSPELEGRRTIIERWEKMFSVTESHHLESEAELRQALEKLPCCVSRESGGPSAEPLNIVIIGTIDDWVTAFVRRNYRYQVLNPRYAFGRAQDISGIKLGQGYTPFQSRAIRLWQTPMRYHGKPVWVGQACSRLGGRFSTKAPLGVTLPLDPDVDEVRDDLTQDLAYSQALIKIGYVRGSGRSRSITAEEPSGDAPYKTDGLRAVLVFGSRPTSLEKIDFFDWERLAEYR